jgi:uncharacterized protein YndB with AHSA1/START domain
MTNVRSNELTVNKRLEFDADVLRVWAALTVPEQIARWFPDAVQIGGFAAGQRGRFVWHDHGAYAFEVLEVVEPTRVVWRWARDPDVELEETAITVVEWTLSARPGGGTVVELRESGFGSVELCEGNDGGWDQELAELVGYLHR